MLVKTLVLPFNPATVCKLNSKASPLMIHYDDRKKAEFTMYDFLARIQVNGMSRQ